MKSVSMIELIANPEKFDGKRVFVNGFVHFEFEGNGLYFHEEDYHNDLRQNGLTLSVTPAQEKQYAGCESKYCIRHRHVPCGQVRVLQFVERSSHRHYNHAVFNTSHK